MLLAFLFIAGAALFRFLALDHQSLWNDELFSLHLAKLPVSKIPEELGQSYFHPPLYFVLLHFVVKWFGTNEWALRFLSAFFGSITVGAIYIATRKMFGEESAMWASLFCLIAPFHVAYSQEARPYALAGFLSVLSLFALYQAWIKKRPAYYTLYIILAVASLYVHHWVAFLLAAQVLFVLIDGILRCESLKLPLIAGFTLAMLYAPLVETVLHQAERVAASPWWWVEPASLEHLVWTGLAFSGSYFKLASGVFDSPFAVEFLTGMLFLILLVLGMLAARKRDERSMRLVLASSLGTIAIAFLLSFFRPEAYLWYRYPVIVFPMFCIALGVGLSYIPFVRFRLIVASAFVILSGIGTFRYYHWDKANAKSVAVFVETIAASDSDVVIRPVYFEELFNYYYRGKARQVNEGSIDSSITPAIQNVNRFVLITLDIPNEVRDYINSHYEKVLEQHFPGEAHMGVLVGVYRKKTAFHSSSEIRFFKIMSEQENGGDSWHLSRRNLSCFRVKSSWMSICPESKFVLNSWVRKTSGGGLTKRTTA
jgi:hypothetical protein